MISIDGDAACTEHLYQSLKNKTLTGSILPLTMDLANPSPNLGWNSSERLSLNNRGQADLLLALALIHHLVFSNCVPLALIAEWFSNLTRYLVVEFIPTDDPMVKKLVQNRNGEHHPYSLEVFQSSFGRYFDFEDQITLQNGRVLYLCKKRQG